jgi:8-oxo-dGTP diphosphatase
MTVQNKFGIAVKGFIFNNKNELLLVKRNNQDPHNPGVWEVPGGRLDEGESPFLGLKREVNEEVGLEIDIKNPLRVHHFVRDDGQKITMITFYCKVKEKDYEVKLSEEHTEYKWSNPNDALEIVTEFFVGDVKRYLEYFKKK